MARPHGSKNRKTAEIAQRAAQEGITPLEVMLSAMRDYWRQGDVKAAADMAAKAAPYVHPRLNAVNMTGTVATTLELVETIIDAQDHPQEHTPTQDPA